ncbi:MAG: hypothetical protein AAGC55_07290 [Myxococcota bacterium]
MLLRPSPELNRLVLGVLGRALQLYDVQLHGFAFLSNHAHWLISPANGGELAKFMAHVLRNISGEVARLHDWEGPLWSRRYRAIPVVDEASQVARLRYICSQGAKEGLCASPREWPGANSVAALADGVALTGTWIDRTAMYNARRSGRSMNPSDFEIVYAVPLSPLPCWGELTESERRDLCAAMIMDIESEAAERNAELCRAPLGVERVLEQDPQLRPRHTAKSPAPLVHAATLSARRAAIRAYRAFVDAFRAAAELLRLGKSPVEFPANSFPPPALFTVLQ